MRKVGRAEMGKTEVGEMEAQRCTPAVLEEPDLCFSMLLLKGSLAGQYF